MHTTSNKAKSMNVYFRVKALCEYQQDNSIFENCPFKLRLKSLGFFWDFPKILIVLQYNNFR